MGLFGPRLPIDRDELEFQLATFKWLDTEFGSVAGRPLVLPTSDFFPAPSGGTPRITALFDNVRNAAGMADWPCELRSGRESRPAQVGFALLLKHEGAEAPCGTFEVEAPDGVRKVVITYNPSLADDTDAMIATFGHELGHYLMSKAKSDPPGGWDLHELHTDLAGVWLGFGIFLANSAKNFRQFQSGGEMGWESRSQGYLSEGALVTALAIFQRLRGEDPLAPSRWLKDYLRTDLKNAAKALARIHPDLERAVDAVDLGEYGSG
ncbi:MAG TPA: hypothetical protein VIT45_02750 [Allosphingosinicella sp.]